MAESKINMELFNTQNEDFISKAKQILREKSELLILVRYPHQAGNKDFFIVRNFDVFLEFLSKRKAKDFICLFKEFETVRKGIITDEFIQEIQKNLNQPKRSDWIVYFEYSDTEEDSWLWVENKLELIESLEEEKGKLVTIIEDIDHLDEESIYHAYTPDEDGQVRPGAY